MKSLGEFLLAKEANAIVVAFLAALLPVFYIPTGFVAVIVVGLVTLQKGPKSGFWILTWVALPAIALLVLRRIGFFDLLFLRCVFMWLFATLMYRYRAWNVVLAAMTFLGMVAVLLVHLAIPDATAWWITHLTASLQRVVSESHWHFDFSAEDFAHQLAPMATGALVFFVACTLFVELLIARFWQSLIAKPRSRLANTGFTHIRAGYVFALLPCVLVLLVMRHVPWALDVLPVTLFPLCIVGLSLLHFLANQKRYWHIVLFFIYAGVILIPALVVAILALIAFIDAVVHFRKRVVKP